MLHLLCLALTRAPLASPWLSWYSGIFWVDEKDMELELDSDCRGGKRLPPGGKAGPGGLGWRLLVPCGRHPPGGPGTLQTSRLPVGLTSPLTHKVFIEHLLCALHHAGIG